ncbi:MAG: dihydrolipoyl dehydrogenase [Candidatus Paracaedibacteraceae bacterium]|nr:dihydrolipoyl dehydrogenase [Candidatus Paracaedibacteraceae bacterium]
MDLSTFDLVVIGAGPGGYVSAIRASQLGMRVAIIDKRKNSGGTCLNIGCIPSKCLLDASHKFWQAKNEFKKVGIEIDKIKLNLEQLMNHKNSVVEQLTSGIDHLFKKNKIHFIHGIANILNANQVEVISDDKKQTLNTKAILIAVGSSPQELEHIPFDGKQIVSSTNALSFKSIPKHLVIIGGGYIGLEMGSVWMRLGSLVTVVEYSNSILAQADEDVRNVLQKTLEKQGMIFKTNRMISGMTHKGKDKELCLQLINPSIPEDNSALPELITCDAVLVAAGRKPATESLGLDALGIKTNRGFISVNNQYQTDVPSIFAIGDCIHGPMLAHKAMDEGVAVAELLAGQVGVVNYNIIPAVIFTHPEIATVGKTENELNTSSIPYKVSKFPFAVNGRAKTIGDTTGFVKIITDPVTNLVIGCAIVGAEAGSLISQVAAIMEFGGSAEDIARTCHAHPTLNEAIKEAAWGSFDKPIHS